MKDSGVRVMMGRREVECKGIWHLLKKKRERDGNLRQSAGGLWGRSVRE